ncbi:hypothetical protein SEUCBS140593_010576 [Sporothrix eucalyptigena]|uniref:C6 zinc finger domain containing protein n=1 Tax=Sporothrix eucalyptigena TaxID=1812306 RepID=A0ABP0D1R0_9PEZI
MATTYYGWAPFTVAEANFTLANCDVAAQWLSAFVNSLYNGTDDSDPPLVVSYAYITALTPSNQDYPTYGQMAEWLGNGGFDSDLFEEMLNYPYDNCPTQVCKALVWEGDGDLAGIGVMVVYYLAAVFVTIYFALLAADNWEPFRKMERHHKRWKYLVGAFHETVSSFIDTGLIFAVAMLISGVYRHGSARLHPDKTHSLYQLTNATYIGIWSIFPPAVLQIITATKRRRRIRAALWFITIHLAVALIALYFSLETSATKLLDLLDRQSALSDLIWEMNCEPITLRDDLDTAVITACVLLVINYLPWLYHILLPVAFRHKIRHNSFVGRIDVTKPTRFGRSWWKNIIVLARTIDGICCSIMMWALLALFTAYRGTIIDRMGPDNSNTEWSFAQVFALATWVPVTIDLLTIYIYGAQDALEGKVSENFRVVENEAREKRKHMGGPGGGGLGEDIDYANLDPFQVVEPNGQYNVVNTQYTGAGGAGQYDDNVAHYGGEVTGQYAGGQYGGQYDPQYGGQYTPHYDTSMSKEAVTEVMPMTTYMQPAPYNNTGVSPPGSYEYMPQDPAATHQSGATQ